MANPTVTQLDASNSATYRARPGQLKKATLVWESADYHLTWGTQHFDGPHMRVSLAAESYGAELRMFFATHKAVPERPHHYVKDAIVRAMRVDTPTDIVTVVDGCEEMRATVEAGGWLIQNPGGEIYSNTSKKFEETYERAEGRHSES